MDRPTKAKAVKRSAGRPRAFDRQKALGIALDLFWRHGYGGVSIGQLTAAMGISPPSLYAAFGSKETLYREAVALYLDRYGGFMSGLLDDRRAAREAVERALQEVARQFGHADHAPGCMVSCAELQAAPDNAALVMEMAKLRQSAQCALHGRLEAARTSGEIPPTTDTASLAAYYAMVIQGMAVQARDGAKTALLKRLAVLAMQAWPE
ncbi:MAG: TetR/AcrR family transcriptional regulator [Betaproteobacteria bacterium]|nr:TetR/AcrR family transcriptional regulator [Betaproteobacteria bacterium]